MNVRTLAVALLAVVTAVGCSSTSSTGPDPVAGAQGSPSPAPTPTPTPTPAPNLQPSPSPSPACDRGLCEAPVTNTNPPVRLSIRVYSAVDGNGRQVATPPANAIPLSYRVTLDAVAKDASGYETNGGGKVNYDFSNAGALSLSGTHPFQVKVQGTRAGEITAWAELVGVRSNDLSLVFIPG
jgi:hypothetical protein